MERVLIAYVSQLRWATASSHNGLAARLKDWEAMSVTKYNITPDTLHLELRILTYSSDQ
jgi:hypothetical protein